MAEPGLQGAGVVTGIMGCRIPGGVIGQVLHGSATTTHAVRAAIQRSKPPLKDLAACYGLNRKTVVKWRKRAFVHDALMSRKALAQLS